MRVKYYHNPYLNENNTNADASQDIRKGFSTILCRF